jgi:protein SCO1/2
MKRGLKNTILSTWSEHKIAFAVLAVSLAMAVGASARTTPPDIKEKAPLLGNERPAEFDGIGITEKLGDKLDLSLPFTDENGQKVTLGKYFDGHKPVSLSLIYYSCPGLCNFHFNGVVEALKGMDWSAGDKFEVLAISFDPRENSEVGSKKRQSYLKVYNRPGTDDGFHFLTADQATIDKLTQQVGFKYKWDDKEKEWAHASAAVIATPDGTIARYLHGIMFDAPTFKLALNEASSGKIGTLVDKMIWYCFKYDPHQSKYVLFAYRAVQVGAVAIILVLAMILLPVWLRGRLLR